MNRLKLGIFGSNLDGGFTATTAEERHRLTGRLSPVSRILPKKPASNFRSRSRAGAGWAE